MDKPYKLFMLIITDLIQIDSYLFTEKLHLFYINSDKLALLAKVVSNICVF